MTILRLLFWRALARPIPPRPQADRAQPVVARIMVDRIHDHARGYAGLSCWPRLFADRKGEYRKEFLDLPQTGFPAQLKVKR